MDLGAPPTLNRSIPTDTGLFGSQQNPLGNFILPEAEVEGTLTSIKETPTREGSTQNGRGNPDKTGVIVLLLRSHKETPISFATILSIATVLIVLGILVNGAICHVMLRGKRYRKNTSNFFILHLSVTELVVRLFIFLTVVYPYVITSEIESIQCKLLRFFSTIFASAIFVSLVAIAFDRYQNIVYPMKALKSKRKPLHLALLVWLYAATVSSTSTVGARSISIRDTPEAQGMDFNNSAADRMLCDIPQNVVGQFSTTSHFILVFLVPLVVIFVLYTKIAIFLHQRSNNGMMHKVAARSKSKAVRMLIVTVFGYVLSLGPAALFSMLRSYGILRSMSFRDMLTVSWVIELVTLTSSLGNPIIYSYYNGDFRKELVKSCCRDNSSPSLSSLSTQVAPISSA